VGRKKKGDGPNKSQAIRDYQVKNPNDGPKAISAALKKEGIKVTPAFVSTIRTMDKKKNMLPLASLTDASLGNVLKAKTFADSVGGIDEALASLQALQQLQ